MTDRTTGSGAVATRRPLIAIPARFAATTSALRYAADVTARALVQSVYDAGGEPLVVHPHAPRAEVSDEEVAARLAFADGLLLPGGGDLSPRWSGQELHETHYDVDEEQDAFDLALARVALSQGIPTLAICRGLQVVTVARGGTLHADMIELGGFAAVHRNHVHRILIETGSALALATGSTTVTASCYHHQSIDGLGEGMRVIARSEDEVPEGVVIDGIPGWFLGVQWHPEDTAATDPQQAGIFRALVDAARGPQSRA
ncbi:MAG: gamma-glutamyl-gamma-aminobutyrate hydrolase family protein [Micrococcales bacterium]|nr:gamma-glutamyl-gamma-aminobutyrate hydrolase family protein [Micrococcales bacterium]